MVGVTGGGSEEGVGSGIDCSQHYYYSATCYCWFSATHLVSTQHRESEQEVGTKGNCSLIGSRNKSR